RGGKIVETKMWRFSFPGKRSSAVGNENAIYENKSGNGPWSEGNEGAMLGNESGNEERKIMETKKGAVPVSAETNAASLRHEAAGFMGGAICVAPPLDELLVNEALRGFGDSTLGDIQLVGDLGGAP